MATRSKLRRGLYWTGGVLGVATALTVAIHLGPVRKALGWKPLGDGSEPNPWCPFGFGTDGKVGGDGKVAQLEHKPHVVADPSLRAHARPALGFTLDVTTHEQIATWAKTHGIACKDRDATMECTNVPAELLPPGENSLAISTAWFSFAAGDRLASVRTIRNSSDSATAVAAFASAETTLTAQAGAPAKTHGAATPEGLAAGALAQASAEYQFGDYRATVRATNMGAQKFVVTESYSTVLD